MTCLWLCYPVVLILSGKVDDVHVDEEPKDKSKRKVMSQLDKLDRGIRIDAVRHHCGVNKLMICFTYKNEDNPVVEQVLKFLLSDVVTPSLKNMEMVMCVWLEDEAQKELSVSGGMTRSGSFGDNKGWFENTKKQMNLCNVKMITESVSTHVVGVVYPVHFREIDETGQFWNKMPI